MARSPWAISTATATWTSPWPAARNQSTQYGIVAGDGTGHFGPLALYQGYTNNADGYDDNYQRAIDYLAVSDFNKDGQIDIVTTALNIGPVGTAPLPTELSE